ncbi:MAG: hypothetical protein V4694_07445 [Pseudomonadota bacterium]
MKKSSSAFSLIEVSLVVLLISLIAAGILTTTNLIKKSRLQTAQVLTKNSPVNDISNLVLWYETSLDSSFIGDEKTDGSAISTWYDNNPNAATKNNATQTTTANKPLFIANAFNSGIPAVRFDGTNDYLLFDGSGVINSSYTIFVVEQKRSSQSNNYFIGGTSNNNANLALGYKSDTSTSLGHWSNDLDYTNSIFAYSTPVTRLHTAAFNITPSLSNSGKRYWFNGSGTSNTIKASNTSQTDPLTAYPGSAVGRFTVNSYFNGDLAEIIIFNRNLTDAERLAVESYLGKKYNLKPTLT